MTMDNTNNNPELEAAGRRWKRWRWVLYVSLALNLLLVGIPVGFFAFGKSEYRALMSSIPADVRRDIRRSLKDARPAIRATMRQAGEQRQALATALAITPYDSTAVGQAFDNLVESYQELIPPVRRTFLSAIEKLDDEDRLKVSEALANMDFHNRRWRHHGRRGDHGDDGDGDR